MNSATLVGSLIFAAVLVVVIAVVIQLMMRGWRRRAQRQQELIGNLPGIARRSGLGELSVPAACIVGSHDVAPDWNERITAGDLGYRSKAVLTRYPEGIMLERIRGHPDLDSAGIDHRHPHRARHAPERLSARNGILAIRWRLPSGVEIDTGFRADHRGEYADWLQEAA